MRSNFSVAKRSSDSSITPTISRRWAERRAGELSELQPHPTTDTPPFTVVLYDVRLFQPIRPNIGLAYPSPQSNSLFPLIPHKNPHIHPQCPPTPSGPLPSSNPPGCLALSPLPPTIGSHSSAPRPEYFRLGLSLTASAYFLLLPLFLTPFDVHPRSFVLLLFLVSCLAKSAPCRPPPLRRSSFAFCRISPVLRLSVWRFGRECTWRTIR